MKESQGEERNNSINFIFSNDFDQSEEIKRENSSIGDNNKNVFNKKVELLSIKYYKINRITNLKEKVM